MSVNGAGDSTQNDGVSRLKPPTLRPGMQSSPMLRAPLKVVSSTGKPTGAIGAPRPTIAIGARPPGAIGASRPQSAIGAPRALSAIGLKPGLLKPVVPKAGVAPKSAVALRAAVGTPRPGVTPKLSGLTGLRPRLQAPAATGPGRGAEHSKMQLQISGITESVKEHDLRLFFQAARIPVARVQIQQPETSGEGQEYVALAEILIPGHEDPQVAADFACHKLSGSEVGDQKVTVEVKGPVEEETGGSGTQLRTAWTPLQALRNLKQQAQGQAGPATGVAAAALKGMQQRATLEQQAEAQQRAGRWKVELCTFWKEGKCTRGELCAYAHGEADLKTESPVPQTTPMTPAERLRKLAEMRGLVRPVGAGPAAPPPAVRPSQQPVGKKLQMCSFWQEGRCSRGTLCAYAHGEHELYKEEKSIGSSRNISQEVRDKLREARERHAAGWKGSGKESKGRLPKGRSDRKGRAPIVFSHEDMLGPAERVKAQVLENGKAMGWNPIMKAKMAPTEVDEVDEEDKPATFLLNEDGVPYLFETYGLGAQLLVQMGWQPGGGAGKELQGRIEPVSVEGMQAATTHFGRRDRRCLGVPPRNEYSDSDRSDESLEAPDDSHRDGRGDRRRGDRKRSVSRSSSYSSSRSRRRRRRKLRPKKRSPGKRRSRSRSRDKADKKDGSARKKARSRSSSKSSSSSSRSSSSRAKKRKRPFTATPPSASASSGNTGAAPPSGVPKVAVPVEADPVKEDPAIAHAKKQVLAKLTVMKNVEPKDQRMKDFRQLLREWHPDKNPERIEMATAVFQFLQKGKSLLNLK